MMHPAKYIAMLVLAGVLLLAYPLLALTASPLSTLKAHSELAGVFVLEADGNGQTYFIHFATGKKYYTGQVSGETGQAFADNGAWLGMTKADLDTIPTGGATSVPVALGELPESLHNELDPVNQGTSNACVAYTLSRITGASDPLALHELFGGGDLGISIFHANTVMQELGYDVHTVAGWYSGTDAQIEAVKRGIEDYGHLASGIDTIKNWDEGVKYPENREYTANHVFTLAGWDDDGWVVYNSYGEEAGTLRYDYPLLWIFGYTEQK